MGTTQNKLQSSNTLRQSWTPLEFDWIPWPLPSPLPLSVVKLLNVTNSVNLLRPSRILSQFKLHWLPGNLTSVRRTIIEVFMSTGCCGFKCSYHCHGQNSISFCHYASFFLLIFNLCVLRICLRGHPLSTYAPRGRGRCPKCVCSKGDCVNLVL